MILVMPDGTIGDRQYPTPEGAIEVDVEEWSCGTRFMLVVRASGGDDTNYIEDLVVAHLRNRGETRPMIPSYAIVRHRLGDA